MSDETASENSKLTRTKRRWASEGRFLTGHVARAAADRLPPGQHLVRDWPVLDLGRQPEVPKERWKLTVGGLVERPAELGWTEFAAMPQTTMRSDIHCVTTWSRYDNDWTGVSARTLLELVDPRDDAQFLMLHGADGYTTNVPLADFAADGVILAHSWQGEPLTRAHGGPVRLVLPHLYFWKSAKWIDAIHFAARDRAGFWEENGYHMRGDPWAEERYGTPG